MSEPVDIAGALGGDKGEDMPNRDLVAQPELHRPDRPQGVDEEELEAALDDPGAGVGAGGRPTDLERRRAVGRLVDPTGSVDHLVDDEADLVADLDTESGAGSRGRGAAPWGEGDGDDQELSAEEAAMHLTDEPSYDASDSYLNERR